MDALHRSFPEAGDGRPLPPMGDELMTAGLGPDDARFVAVQLAQNGYQLVQAAEIERLRRTIDAAFKLGRIVGFLGEDEGLIEAFREECGPELLARVRAALIDKGAGE